MEVILELSYCLLQCGRQLCSRHYKICIWQKV